MSRSDIQNAWNAHVQRPFPRECAGKEVDGVCLTSCDTFLAGCVSHFVESGTLDATHIEVVENVVADLTRVVPQLQGEAYDYFSALLALGAALETRSNAR